MSNKQLNRYTVIDQANKGFITVREAAEALGLSERQIQRLKKKVRELGVRGVIHQNTGKAPVNALPTQTKEKIIQLKNSDLFRDCNFAHFKELLSEHYGIEVSYGCLYHLLSAQKILSPKTRRRLKPHRRRSRRPQAGLLLQVDATPYPWFKADSTKYSLHGAIDDATGQITGLFMTKNECLYGYICMLKRTIENYGIPISLYADRHTIFQSPNTEKAKIDSSIKPNDTQLGRMLKELEVQLIPARSPQAKGRVERLWQTLQSRLPVEFSLHGITNMEAANEFLATYIYAFNSQFAVEPKDTQSQFRKFENMEDLRFILCTKEPRVIDAGGVFSYYGKSFKVIETINTGIIPKKATIQVLAGKEFGIRVAFKNTIFDALPYVPPKRQAKPKTQTSPIVHTPAEEHYWKGAKDKGVFFEDSVSDQQMLRMLDDIFLSQKSGLHF